MKTLIAIPCFDKLDTVFVQSLTKMRTVGDMELSFVTGTLIYDARNKIAENAVKEGYDYVLWLDSDMTFEPDLCERLFKSIGDKDFISGLYFSRRPPIIKPVIFKTCGATVTDGVVFPDTEQYFDYPRNSIFEIEACGYGAVLQKTEMLQRCFDEIGLPFCPQFGFGEDLAACMRFRQLGYKLWCDSSIKLGHVMVSESNEETYLLSSAIRHNESQ